MLCCDSYCLFFLCNILENWNAYKKKNIANDLFADPNTWIVLSYIRLHFKQIYVVQSFAGSAVCVCLRLFGFCFFWNHKFRYQNCNFAKHPKYVQSWVMISMEITSISCNIIKLKCIQTKLQLETINLLIAKSIMDLSYSEIIFVTTRI